MQAALSPRRAPPGCLGEASAPPTARVHAAARVLIPAACVQRGGRATLRRPPSLHRAACPPPPRCHIPRIAPSAPAPVPPPPCRLSVLCHRRVPPCLFAGASTTRRGCERGPWPHPLGERRGGGSGGGAGEGRRRHLPPPPLCDTRAHLCPVSPLRPPLPLVSAPCLPVFCPARFLFVFLSRTWVGLL